MGAARREVEYIGGFSMLRGYRIRSIAGGGISRWYVCKDSPECVCEYTHGVVWEDSLVYPVTRVSMPEGCLWL